MRSSAILVLLILAVYRLSAPLDYTWAHGSADAGDLIAAAASGGVAHPPGYGAYTALAAIALRIPVSESPFVRVVWLSHALALTAALLIAVRPREFSPVVFALAALSAPLWSQAIVVEVYAASAALFAAMVALSLNDISRRWQAFALGHLAVLAVSHHLTTLLWLPGFAILLWGRIPRRLWLWLILGALTGTWGWAALILRAGGFPPLDWGGIGTGWDAFWTHISGEAYRVYLMPFSIERIWDGIRDWAVALGPSGIVLLPLAILGLIRFRRDYPRLLLTTAVWLCLLAGFASHYDAVDAIDGYTLPVTLICAWWGAAALGVRGKEEGARDGQPHADYSPLPQGEGLGVRAIVLVFVLTLLGWNAVNLRDDRAAHDFIATADVVTPPGAVIIVSEDEDTFALHYAHYAAGWRPDVLVVNAYMLDFDWYVQGLNVSGAGLPAGTNPRALIDTLIEGRPAASPQLILPPVGRTARQVRGWTVID